jgi:MoxR-like ATPase
VHLLAAAQASAALADRTFVTPDDVAEMAPSVLAHRLILTADAELEGFRARDAIRVAMAEVPVPR